MANTNGQESAEDPAAAERWTHVRMWSHIEQKGVQLGSVLGVAVSPALMYFRNGTLLPSPTFLTKTSAGGIAAGLVLANVLGAVKLLGEPREAVEDRVYRLYYNEMQNRVDSFAQAGMLAGLAAAVYSNGRSKVSLRELVGHIGVGVAIGVCAHGATAPQKIKLDAKSMKDSVDKMN